MRTNPTLSALTMVLCSAFCAHAQTNATTGTAAGLGAGAALGAASGSGTTTPSSATSGGGSTPIEIQVMSYRGMRDIAEDIAQVTASRLDCGPTPCPKRVLIEDSTSAAQIGLASALDGFFQNIESIHGNLQQHLALTVTPGSIEFSTALPNPVLVTLRNDSFEDLPIQTLRIMPVVGAGATFDLASGTCALSALGGPGGYATTVPKRSACTVSLTFKPAQAAGKSSTSLQISTVLLLAGQQVRTTQAVQLTATSPEPPPRPARLTQQEWDSFLDNNRSQLVPTPTPPGFSNNPAPLTGTGGTAAPATTPLGLTYLSGLQSEITALKSGITYSPSTFQPTTQSFQVLLESELKRQTVQTFTSTSVLNLDEATADLAQQFARILSYGVEIANWTTLCKAGAAASTAPGQPATPAFNPECNKSDVLANLQIAQQLVVAYSTLLQPATDSAGNPLIVDVLRGKVLRRWMEKGVPSLQVSVAAAGGSTRTNNFFLLNLFYTPKPSYNAGAIVTFELRGRDNDLLAAGARNVLYDYTKWKPRKFQSAMTEAVEAGCAFCASEEK